MMKYYSSFLIIIISFGVFSCSSNSDYVPTPEPKTKVSPVVFDIENVPYQTLSEYNFFENPINDLKPVYGVLPYSLNSTLFTDYAKKKRFVWMPENRSANYVNDYSSLDFQTGSILIKNFYYNNVQPSNTTKIIETRLMIKKETGWEFANYVWNESQDEAFLTEDASIVNLEWIQDEDVKSTNYKIPSQSECFTCHNKFGTPVPIGPKPQNINRDFLYSDGSENQLEKWVEYGYLNPNYPTNINSTVKWDDTSLPLDLRARSYVDINCAHCHNEEGYCEYRPMRFAFNENDDLINMGVCVTPDTNIDNSLTHIVAPNSPNESVVFFRMQSTLEEYRMPLLGRTLEHKEGTRLIEEWINSLTTSCQ